MCKIGDIIVVDSYIHEGKSLTKHSFIVINDQNGEIQSLKYDFIANVLSSTKSKEQRKHKLKYPGNFPIVNEDTQTIPDNKKDGYLKTDQLYYFNKETISYKKIGNVDPDIMDLILEFINESNFPIIAITDNL